MNGNALWRDTRGTSLIETALVMPVLALLLCGVVDVSLGFAGKLRVQQGADRAVQFALNAGVTTATEILIKNEAVAGAAVPADKVTVQRWLECGGVVQVDFNGICTSGAPARYISVTVADSYTPLFTSVLSLTPIQLQGFGEGRIQ